MSSLWSCLGCDQEMKMVKLGSTFPNFKANTTIGQIQFHEWIGDSWAILFSHPADFTPVCTTELARSANLHDEFQCRNVKLIAVSCDSVEAHKNWISDINFVGDIKEFPFPIISDQKRELAIMLDMIDPDEKDSEGMPLTARAVFVIDPSKRMRLSILYPANVGRNFNEILRVVDALQLSDKYKVATPADWKPGNKVMIQPAVPEEELNTLFPTTETTALPSGKKYFRKVQIS